MKRTCPNPRCVLMAALVAAGAALLTVGVVALLVHRNAPLLTSELRRRLEQGLADASGEPASVGSMRLSLAPLGVDVRDIAIGRDGDLCRIGGLRLDVAIVESLAGLRPVIVIEAVDIAADLTRLSPAPDREPDANPWIPPLRVERGTVERLHLRFPMDDGPGELDVDRIDAAADMAGPPLRIAVTAAVREARLRRESYRVRLETVSVTGGVDDTGIFVRDARVVGDGVLATATAAGVTGQTLVRGTFRPSILGVLVDELAAIDGLASVEGSLTGDLARPVVDAQLTVVDGTLAGRAVGNLSARATVRGANLHFADIILIGPAGRVRGDVDLILLKEVPIRVDAEAEDLDVKSVLAATGVDAALRVRLDGTTQMRGQLDPPDFTVFGAGTVRSFIEGRPSVEATWEAGVRLLKDDLAVHLDARHGQNVATGEFLLVGDRIGGGLSATVAEVAAVSALLPGPIVVLAPSGKFRADATLAGTLDRPTFSGSVDARELTLGGAPVQRLRGDFTIAADGLTTRETTVETPAGAGRFAGRVALDPDQQNDWVLHLDRLNSDGTVHLVEAVTGTRLPVSGGTLSGQSRCSGPWSGARCETEIDARWVRVGPEPFERINFTASATLPAWAARLRAERTAAESLRVTGTGVAWERVDLRIDSDPLHLTSLFSTEADVAGPAAGPAVSGSVRVAGHLSGAPARLDGELTVVGAAVAVRRQPIGDVRLHAVAQGGEWTIAAEAFSGLASLRATVPAAPAPSTLTLRWRDLELGPLLVADSALSVRSTGSVDLRSRGLAADMTTGTVNVDELDISRGAYRVRAREPVRVRVDRGRFSVVPATLEGPKTALTVSGEWTVSGAVNLALDGEGDLVLLELVVPRVQSANGPFSVNVRVNRSPGGAWDLTGEARVADGVVDADLPVVFGDVDGIVVLRGAVVEVRQLTGRAGNGTFAVSGTLDLDHGPALEWQVDNIAMTAPEWLEERFSGRGSVAGNWQEIVLRGDIDVEHALYQRDVAITDLLPWLTRELAAPPAAGSPPSVVVLDLHIRAPDSLFVENNFARAELGADLRVVGTLDAPGLTGVIEVLSGDVTVNKRVFTVTGGSVDFRDPTRINPVLNLSAETQILTREGLYLVTATVSGTADNPRVQLGSDDPSLTQNDILSLVATGRTAREAARDSTGFSPASALAFVPTRGFQDFLSGTVGLDMFELDTGRVEDTGPVLPRVTIGKQLTEDLRVTASNTLVETLTRVTVDYRVGRRFSIFGTWESQSTSGAGAFGGGGTLRYNFRGSPFSLLRGLRTQRPTADAQ